MNLISLRMRQFFKTEETLPDFFLKVNVDETCRRKYFNVIVCYVLITIINAVHPCPVSAGCFYLNGSFFESNLSGNWNNDNNPSTDDDNPDYIFSLLKHDCMVITWMKSCNSPAASFLQQLDVTDT